MLPRIEMIQAYDCICESFSVEPEPAEPFGQCARCGGETNLYVKKDLGT